MLDVLLPVAHIAQAFAQALIDAHLHGAQFVDLQLHLAHAAAEVLVESAFRGLAHEALQALAFGVAVADQLLQLDQPLLVTGEAELHFRQPFLHAGDEALGVVVVQLGSKKTR